MSKRDLSDQVLQLLYEAKVIGAKERLQIEQDQKFHKLREQLNQLAIQPRPVESLQKLQIVLDEAPCTISWINSDFTYMGVNKVMSDLCGVTQDEFKGKELGFYTNENHFSRFIKMLFASEQERIDQELEATINGELKWYYIVGRKYDNNSKAVLIGLDITRQKLMEQNLILKEKMVTIGELSASIVHEINNPLTVIQGCIAKFKKSDDPIVQQANEKLKRMADRIYKIANGLKKFSHGSQNDPLEEVSIKEVFKDSIELCSQKITDKRVKLKVECPDDLYILGNEVEISQVIVNLVSNACDAIQDRPDRWVHLQAQTDADKVVIWVTDSGEGIPLEMHQSILSPFFTTKDKNSGTGLGLSISRTIVSKHKGEFRIDPDCSNTRFVVQFPHHKKSTAAA